MEVVLQKLESAKKELQTIKTFDETINRLEKELEDELENLTVQSLKLSSNRKIVAERLAEIDRLAAGAGKGFVDPVEQIGNALAQMAENDFQIRMLAENAGQDHAHGHRRRYGICRLRRPRTGTTAVNALSLD